MEVMNVLAACLLVATNPFRGVVLAKQRDQLGAQWLLDRGNERLIAGLGFFRAGASFRNCFNVRSEGQGWSMSQRPSSFTK